MVEDPPTPLSLKVRNGIKEKESKEMFLFSFCHCTLGKAMCQKSTSPDLGRGVHGFLCVVLCCHYVKKCNGLVKEHALRCFGEGGEDGVFANTHTHP